MRHMLVVLLLASACAGCAFTEDKIDVNYRATAMPPVPGAAGVMVEVDAIDRRPGDAMQVGSKKNGYGMEMASIKASRPVSAIVQDAITDGTSALKVVADVVRFRNTFDTGFFSAEARSDVTLAVQVRSARGDISYSRTITGEGVEKGVQIMGGDNAKISLERALPDAVGKIVNDPDFIRALTGSGSRPIS